MLIYIALLVVGCAGLYTGGEFLIRGAVVLGSRFGMAPAVIGLTIVSAGTSAPELAVSVGAAIQGLGEFAAGNVVGSNVVNIAVVLGLAAAVRALPVAHDLVRRDLPLLTLLTAMACWMLSDGHLERLEAAFLFAFLVFNVVLALRQTSAERAQASADTDQSVVEQVKTDVPVGRSLALLAAGSVILVFSAEALIYSGTGLARTFGVSDAVIALTVTSIGTSIPEIAASLIATLRRESAIAIGNVVGSNLFNLGMVLGISGLITPIESAGVGWLPLSIMMALTLLLWFLAARLGYIGRWVGVTLLAIFSVYGAALVN